MQVILMNVTLMEVLLFCYIIGTRISSSRQCYEWCHTQESVRESSQEVSGGCEEAGNATER